MAIDVDGFELWLRGRGVPEAHLRGYRFIAERVLTEAGGNRVFPKHVDPMLQRLAQEGTVGAKLANAKRVADELLKYQAEADPPRPPGPPPPSPKAPPPPRAPAMDLEAARRMAR